MNWVKQDIVESDLLLVLCQTWAHQRLEKPDLVFVFMAKRSCNILTNLLSKYAHITPVLALEDYSVLCLLHLQYGEFLSPQRSLFCFILPGKRNQQPRQDKWRVKVCYNLQSINYSNIITSDPTADPVSTLLL